MKIFAAYFLILTLSLASAQSTSTDALEIASLFKAFHNFSKQQSVLVLNQLENPFEHHHQERTPLVLQAIINGKALINDQWYSINDTINGYKIIDISSQSLLLQKPKATLTLLLNENLND